MRRTRCETRIGFAEGTAVRVRAGVMDPDFPGIHLGGWAGTVAEVREEAAGAYLIQWNPKTLEAVPRVVRDCCKRADMVFDKMWLTEDDLEAAHAAESDWEPPR